MIRSLWAAGHNTSGADLFEVFRHGVSVCLLGFLQCRSILFLLCRFGIGWRIGHNGVPLVFGVVLGEG